ncbi:hypothetical protein GCM10029976_079900 [Kribbella albertanoniae]|uniref:Uncharacterized protein n=1 Tax=Kribbella albertanoniae TaxID=1266829 RepID=A0A4R4NX38_9ACTN|nr:hypothetical protein [Kribbella albertanoniae]TDC14105.1 hypothetical protein E1261_44265 [Kribbella albertanoniae]
MPTMGELGPAEWTAELQRSGRVVFQLRRRPVALRAAVILLLLAPSNVFNIGEFADESTVGRIFDVFGWAVYAFILGGITWQLVTRRPIVVVDGEGIRSGSRFMPWDAVGKAGIPHGARIFSSLPVLPADVWAKEIRILRDNVRDLTAFSAWLNDLRPQRRRTEEEPHADHG